MNRIAPMFRIGLHWVLLAALVTLTGGCALQTVWYQWNGFRSTTYSPSIRVRPEAGRMLHFVSVTPDSTVMMIYTSDQPHPMFGKPGQVLRFADPKRGMLTFYRIAAASPVDQTVTLLYSPWAPGSSGTSGVVEESGKTVVLPGR